MTMDEEENHHHHPRVLEWDSGLPQPEDLTPLTQSLITPELASAFGIIPEPSRSLLDLNRASHDTYSTICRTQWIGSGFEFGFESASPLKLFPDSEGCNKICRAVDEVDSGGTGSVVAAAAAAPNNEEAVNADDNGVSRAVKRPRLVWTPQLHKRFVDVIEHLGIDKAVPKTIMEMMNVEGLTRENVASHLQKYRLYLKRVEGSPSEGQTPGGGGTPKHNNSVVTGGYDGASNGCLGQMQLQLQHCGSVPLMPIPMIGAAATGYGHLGVNVGAPVTGGYGGLESGAYNNWLWGPQRG